MLCFCSALNLGRHTSWRNRMWMLLQSSLVICRHNTKTACSSAKQKLNSSRLVLDPTWLRSLPNTLTVASSSIHCAHAVRNPGVILDSELSTKSHISKTASACFLDQRRLRQLRDVVTDEVIKQLVTSLVLSRLDYCNSVLFGLPASTLALAPLQRVQNVAARLVLRLDHRAHIKPALQRTSSPVACEGTNLVQDCHRDAGYS